MSKNLTLTFKIIGWALLLHIILMALTVLEVFIYSTFVNRGQPNQEYEKHAEQSRPYVGIIVGFVLTYTILLILTKKMPGEQRILCIALPVAYIAIDIALLLVSGAALSGNLMVFGISYATKLLAGYLVLKR